MNEARTVVAYWIVAASLLLSLGCSVKQPVIQEVKLSTEEQLKRLPSVPEVKYFTHKIKWSGENIIRISRWYTGSGGNWLRIVEANPSIDPRRIKIGDSILIPEDLLKTREPMPQSYRVPAASSKSNKTKSAIEPLPTSGQIKKVEPVPALLPAASENKKPGATAKPLPGAGEVELFGPLDIESHNDGVEGTRTSVPLETIE